jgi:ABC-type transport system involved in multi-copper enzyme maturation permease subunit
MTAIAPYRSLVPARRAGFAHLLHAEWTKLRTVRGWLVGLLLIPLLTVGFGALISSGSECGYMYPGPDGQTVSGPCSAPTGPGGELVQDQFYFTRQALTGDGVITARITALTSSSLQPWAKAGIIIKASTTPGSAYAAMLVTGTHGVRMQWNFTQDTAGMPGTVSAASPRWLRLARAGDTVTGYDSADGTNWTEVGRTTLAGLPSTAQVGMFAATPPQSGQHAVAVNQAVTSTGAFDHVGVTGAAAGRDAGTNGSWRGIVMGADPGGGTPGGFQQTASGFTVTGIGDIAPDTGEGAGAGTPISHTLDGIFAGLIVAIVLGVIFVTAEYRRGLIRTTLTASPARGRVIAAKAIVLGVVTFVLAFVGCAISVPLGEHLLRSHGNVMDPVSTLTWLRIVGGTAAVFAAAAVFGVALGAIFRRGAAAVSTAIVLIVLPWFLAVSSPALPATVSDWLLRISPSAALAIQQVIPKYPQVDSDYLPHAGFYPLAPWAGFAVLCVWTAGALWLAVYLLRSRDV